MKAFLSPYPSTLWKLCPLYHWRLTNKCSYPPCTQILTDGHKNGQLITTMFTVCVPAILCSPGNGAEWSEDVSRIICLFKPILWMFNYLNETFLIRHTFCSYCNNSNTTIGVMWSLHSLGRPNCVHTVSVDSCKRTLSSF